MNRFVLDYRNDSGSGRALTLADTKPRRLAREHRKLGQLKRLGVDATNSAGFQTYEGGISLISANAADPFRFKILVGWLKRLKIETDKVP